MSELLIHHIDVGQGDATLIILKGKYTESGPITWKNQSKPASTSLRSSEILFAALIDFGPNAGSGEAVYKFCDRKLCAIAGEREAKKLDAIVVSHFDRDHVYGINRFVELCLNRNLCNEQTLLLLPTLVAKAKEWACLFQNVIKDENYLVAKPDDMFVGKDFSLKCISSNENVKEGEINNILKSIEDDEDDEDDDGAQQQMDTDQDKTFVHRKTASGTKANAISLAWHCEHKGSSGIFNYYTAGDLTNKYERQIANNTKFLFDAIKLSHHGSHGSTPEELSKLIKQGGAVFITPGRVKRFSHPHIETLEKINARIFCTGRLDEFRLLSSIPAKGSNPTDGEWNNNGGKGVFTPESNVGVNAQCDSLLGELSGKKLKRVPREFCASAITLIHRASMNGYIVSQDVFQPQDIKSIREYIKNKTVGWLTPPVTFVGVDFLRLSPDNDDRYEFMHDLSVQLSDANLPPTEVISAPQKEATPLGITSKRAHDEVSEPIAAKRPKKPTRTDELMKVFSEEYTKKSKRSEVNKVISKVVEQMLDTTDRKACKIRGSVDIEKKRFYIIKTKKRFM